jgi:hypothetical protein
MQCVEDTINNEDALFCKYIKKSKKSEEEMNS